MVLITVILSLALLLSLFRAPPETATLSRSPPPPRRQAPAVQLRARARLADHGGWSWGSASPVAAYGPPVLAATFVLLDLSRLAATPAATAQPLAGFDYEALATSAWTSVREAVSASAALEPAPWEFDARHAFDLAALPEPAHTFVHAAAGHDGWLI